MPPIGSFLGDDFVDNRVLWLGAGYSREDLSRPIIGIANSYSAMVPGHAHLRQLAEQVKYGVYRAGGTPAEFGLIACCDGLAAGHSGNNYVLPSRELIADSVETVARAHRLDGLVLLGSCDKIVPGLLMAAARLDLPAILVPGGPMLPGGAFGDRAKTDATTASEAQGRAQTGALTRADVERLVDITAPSCGSCQVMGTANSMGCFAEALGLTLPGGSLIPAVYHDRSRQALASGEAAVALTRAGLSARRLLTRESLENAAMAMMAVGGSTNTVIHACALAHELGLDPHEMLDAFDRHSDRIPLVAKINPATHSHDALDLFLAGGLPEILKVIRPFLHTGALTVTGRTLGENLDAFQSQYPPNPELIRPLDNPHSGLGGLAVLRGNLAPDTAVSKPAAIHESARVFTGRAVCFDSEDECVAAVNARRITAGQVVVIRYEGPKGGPGMKELYKPMKMLNGQGLSRSTAVITDGRFSGTNSGCFVGHISPEAAAGGPLALVRDGDEITIDINRKSLTLHVSDEELAERRRAWTPTPRSGLTGWLERYAALVTSADRGGVLVVPK